MQKKILVSILLTAFIPCLCAGQWTSNGFVNGLAYGDKLGMANTIAMDADGNTMAVGSAVNSQLGTFFGYAKVFDWNGSQWIQRGQTIDGSAIFEGTGGSVDLSADGNTLVVSSPYGFNSLNWKVGLVRVFDWNGTQWIQRGNTIEGEGNPSPLLRDDAFGYDVSITPDGNYLAIGAPSNTKQAGVLQIQGHVRVFKWNGTLWTQMGQDIDGTVGLEEFGRVLDLSADGSILVVGARSYRTSNNNYIGSVQTFTWNGTEWTEFGTRITGQASADRFGSSISLSNDGSTLAIGARETNGAESAVLVFTKDTSSWVAKGLPILGILNDLISGTCSLNPDGNIIGVGFQWTNNISGVAKVFQWNGTSWTQVGVNLVPTGNSPFPAFGSEICISNDGLRILIGSSGDDTADENAGKVYMFQNTPTHVNGIDMANHLDVFPNPVSNKFQVKSSTKIDSYSLFSIDGKIVKSEKGLNYNQVTIDATELNSGIYFLSINANNNIKIIKN
jgi:hypothetical protein